MVASLFLGIFGVAQRDCGGFVAAFGRKQINLQTDLQTDLQGEYGTMNAI